MKRIIAWLLLGALVCAAPGAWAQQEAGQALVHETTIQFSGLPLLDEETNAALKSLFGAMRLRLIRQGAQGEGYASLDLFLQDQSVIDFTLEKRGGVYYEQSNLLGGQTVAFTPMAFSAFVPRLAERSGGALPQQLDWLYELMTFALGGGEVTMDMETLNAWITRWEAWRKQSLMLTEVAVPASEMPGIAASRAAQAEITRAEMLALAASVSELLAPQETLWLSAAQVRVAEESEAAQTLSAIRETLETLPDALAAWLPLDLPPARFFELYDAKGAVVSRQFALSLPDGLDVSLEWLATEEEGLPPLCLMITAANSRFEWRVTESGAQLTLTDPELSFDATLTRSEAEQSETLFTLQSETLLGAGAMLHARSTDRPAGTKSDYPRTRETQVWLTGLGFDELVPLTITTRTTAQAAVPPLQLETAVFPSTLPEAALDAWLEGVRVSATQALFTVMGRLPSDVAAYLLQIMP
ncbi:MAG: hypothetical protein LBM74_09315 [Oscillospiraceae bacterium]|nr:hypothetical protein [Oscillospiraceae bacterium]